MEEDETKFEQQIANAVRSNRRQELKNMFAQFEAETQLNDDSNQAAEKNTDDQNPPSE